MNNDKAKAAILDKCCQKVDCLARGEVIDLEGVPDLHQRSSPETETERAALVAYLDVFLDPNPAVQLSGLVCKHGTAIEACPSRECENPMAYETAIRRARDFIKSGVAQYSQEQVRNIVHHQISGHLHPDTAKQISEIVANQIVALTDTSTDRQGE
jgi:hypothetical protein